MPEVPHAAQHHHHLALIGRGNHFSVAHAAAGLNHAAGTSVNRATDSPARCIRVWGGSVAAACCSICRVAATLKSGWLLALEIRCMADCDTRQAGDSLFRRIFSRFRASAQVKNA